MKQLEKQIYKWNNLPKPSKHPKNRSQVLPSTSNIARSKYRLQSRCTEKINLQPITIYITNKTEEINFYNIQLFINFW